MRVIGKLERKVRFMKKIGLVGGLGPASTVDYYLGLINKYREIYGEDEYPQIMIDSVNMHEVVDSIARTDYVSAGKILSTSLKSLQAGGTEVFAITANTPHIAWEHIEPSYVPSTVHIVDATINKMLERGYNRVVIMGTVFTMKSGMYEEAMIRKKLIPIVPSDEDKEIIGNCIYPNLENGIVIQEDKNTLIMLAEKYIKSGNADGVLLGCTELPLAIKEGDVSVPILDTTQIHIEEIFNEAMSEEVL